MMSAGDERSARTGYAVNLLDRAANFRDDEARLASWRTAPNARTVVLAGDTVILKGSNDQMDPLFSLPEAAALGRAEESVFLGLNGDSPVFGVAISADHIDMLKTRGDLIVSDARSLASEGLLPPDALGPLAEAKALLHWHRRHRFCAACGAPTHTANAGWKRICSACESEHFPRTDPVVIMMAVKGDNCVLGRQARFNPGMYSCLAGFVEPGETIEDAVRREIFEEAGIRIGRVRYLASQPWPFPASLMIGAIAEALDEALNVDTQELEDARWFSRDEVRAMLDVRHSGGLVAPKPFAIAHAIMRAWAVEGESL
jgi:NAD+ diphosphatase